MGGGAVLKGNTPKMKYRGKKIKIKNYFTAHQNTTTDLHTYTVLKYEYKYCIECYLVVAKCVMHVLAPGVVVSFPLYAH